MPGLGELIRTARLHTGLSQGALARRAQIDPAVLSNIESGKRTGLRFETVARLAVEVGLSLDSLAHQLGYDFHEGPSETLRTDLADLAERLDRAKRAQQTLATELATAQRIVGARLRRRRKKPARRS